MATKKNKISKAVIAAMLATSLGVWLFHKAPQENANFGVTSPSTRGFGTACDTADFKPVPVLHFGLRTWNKGAEMQMRAVDKTLNVLKVWEPPTFDGTYNCRTIAGSSTYSHHAWALALDVDAGSNAMGTPPRYCEINFTTHPTFIKTFIRYGFYWGGSFSTRPDCMHFEYDGPVMKNRANRYPGGRDPHNALAKALKAVGLPSEFDGRYTGTKEETAVLAFQKKNHLLRVDSGGIVAAPTWTLLLLAAK